MRKKPSRTHSPHFPYTTLFRSFVEFPSQVFEHWLEVPETLRRYARHYRTDEAQCFRHFEDRKSTRLNSSHVSSSYAVFCLKKKNRGCAEETRRTDRRTTRRD